MIGTAPRAREQADRLRWEFSTATFLLDSDEAGKKLVKQAARKLLPLLPIRLIRAPRDPDTMTENELKQLLETPVLA